jgi:lipoprotein-releasing system permease protein
MSQRLPYNNNMNLTLKMAATYIFSKHKEKFISFNAFFTVIGITLAVTTLIVVISVMNGLQNNLKTRIIGLGAHIQIEKFGGEKNEKEIQQKIENLTKSTFVAPYITGQGTITTGREIKLLSINGVEQVQEQRATNISKYMKTGTFDTTNKGIVIGNELAKSSYFKIGDSLLLYNPSINQHIRYTIKGIFYTGIYAYDSHIIYMDITEAKKFLNTTTITGYKVHLENDSKIAVVKSNLLMGLNSSYDVNTWQDLNRSLLAALQVEKKIMLLILSVLIILSGFSISSTLIMNVFEKKKDIGILKTLGFSKNQIRNIFLLNGLLLCAFGLIFGISLGLIISSHVEYIANFLYTLLGFQLFPDDIYYMNKISSVTDPKTIIYVSVFSVIISLCASFYPALRASNLDPVECIKHE